MKLMIIESSGKLEKLRAILASIRPGENWKVVPSLGHIRDLPATGQDEGLLTTGVRADLTPIYEMTEKGAKIVSSLRQACAQATEIYLATDPDREGESIAWHIKEAVGIRNPIRVAFGDVTATGVDAALKAPRKIDMKRVAAQEARRVADRVIGYMVSPELRRQTGQNLSAGRVQSVALYLVVLRERAIRSFKSTTHYGAELFFAGAKNEDRWSAEWMTAEGFTTEDAPYFMDKRYAELVAKVGQVLVVGCENKERLRNPPAPFITTTMQQATSNQLGWNGDHTMKVAQSLFDQGIITYHRTDNPNLSEDSMPAVREVLQSLGLEVVGKRREFSAGEGAQEGHPATTPTHWEVAEAGSTPDEQTLYRMIRIRALASQMMPARYAVRTAYLKAVSPVEGKQVLFGAKGETLMAPGWLKLQSMDAASDDDEEDTNNPIPQLQPGQVLDALSGKLLEKKTKAPKRYTEASLVGELASNGIGRPATYAAIVKNILGREYIKVVSRFFHAQPVGELVIERLEGKFTFLQVGYTRDLESDLDRISTGETQYKPVIAGLVETLQGELGRQLAEVEAFKKVEVAYDCPDCKKEQLRRIKGANGPFWACKGYPACEATFPDAGGKPGQRKVVQLSEYKCDKCEKPLIHRTKKGGKGGKGGFDFWGCSGFKDGCARTFPNDKGKPDMAKGKG
ncbi:type I DNA topoisomerase (plasmid) [Pseudomonas alloputida]|uniref:type I DNA topoisomerase n=1 Tax=Pseudomonas alloputida TaxID=1940621 RepID=UPI003B436160